MPRAKDEGDWDAHAFHTQVVKNAGVVGQTGGRVGVALLVP